MAAYLGDPRFEPLWQELDRRKAVVFVHPIKPPNNPTNIPVGVLEFVFDTTRTITSLIYSGATIRYPDIKFIFAHGGGTAPYLASRIEGGVRLDPKLGRILPNGVMPELKKFYWDTALTFSDTQLKSLLTLADPSKVMFGSDFPFAPKMIYPVALKSLNTQLPPAILTEVLHGSALRLMPTLA
jgi:predicted TIM-barrel fold metal-dependent hydrolase